MDTYASRKRSRSRSPYRHSHEHVKRHRSRAPHRHHELKELVKLPFCQQLLYKHDFEAYKPLFAEYLEVQKRIDIDELPEHEVKGRWKSFLKKWNQAELSEGWYEPDMKRRVDERWRERPPRAETGSKLPTHGETGDDNDEEDEDGYGPSLPTQRFGPSIPNLDELQARREALSEDRSAQLADLRHERKADRALQKSRLEELAPRADPGSRERQLEKRRDAAAVNRDFRDAKDAGDVEVGDGEMMGGGEDDYRAKLKAQEKVKNEREIRKEEVLRARMAEREVRLAEHRKKEEKTMDMLRNIARQRFG